MIKLLLTVAVLSGCNAPRLLKDDGILPAWCQARTLRIRMLAESQGAPPTLDDLRARIGTIGRGARMTRTGADWEKPGSSGLWWYRDAQAAPATMVLRGTNGMVVAEQRPTAGGVALLRTAAHFVRRSGWMDTELRRILFLQGDKEFGQFCEAFPEVVTMDCRVERRPVRPVGAHIASQTGGKGRHHSEGPWIPQGGFLQRDIEVCRLAIPAVGSRPVLPFELEHRFDQDNTPCQSTLFFATGDDDPVECVHFENAWALRTIDPRFLPKRETKKPATVRPSRSAKLAVAAEPSTALPTSRSTSHRSWAWEAGWRAPGGPPKKWYAATEPAFPTIGVIAAPFFVTAASGETMLAPFRDDNWLSLDLVSNDVCAALPLIVAGRAGRPLAIRLSRRLPTARDAACLHAMGPDMLDLTALDFSAHKAAMTGLFAKPWPLHGVAVSPDLWQLVPREIESLSLVGTKPVELSLARLAGRFSNLRSLSLAGTFVNVAFSSLTALRTLSLRGYYLSNDVTANVDLRPLSELRDLRLVATNVGIDTRRGAFFDDWFSAWPELRSFETDAPLSQRSLQELSRLRKLKALHVTHPPWAIRQEEWSTRMSFDDPPRFATGAGTVLSEMHALERFSVETLTPEIARAVAGLPNLVALSARTADAKALTLLEGAPRLKRVVVAGDASSRREAQRLVLEDGANLQHVDVSTMPRLEAFVADLSGLSADETGPWMERMQSHPRLRRLSLKRAKLTERHLEILASLKGLLHLSLEDDSGHVSDKLMRALATLPLLSLNIDGAGVSLEGLTYFRGHPTLRVFRAPRVSQQIAGTYRMAGTLLSIPHLTVVFGDDETIPWSDRVVFEGARPVRLWWDDDEAPKRGEVRPGRGL